LRLASLALVAALTASSHVAVVAACQTPRRALLQVPDAIADSIASISQAVADVADETAQAVVDVAKRLAEEVEDSMAPAPAPEARRRALLQVSDTLSDSVASISETVADIADTTARIVVEDSERMAEDVEDAEDWMAPAPAPEARRRALLQAPSTFTLLEIEIVREQKKMIEALAPSSEATREDYVEAGAPSSMAEPVREGDDDADDSPRRSLLQTEYASAPVSAPAPEPGSDLDEYEDVYTSMPELVVAPEDPPASAPISVPDLPRRRRAMLQFEYADYEEYAVTEQFGGEAPAPAPTPA
jgi:hypothetical protein